MVKKSKEYDSSNFHSYFFLLFESNHMDHGYTGQKYKTKRQPQTNENLKTRENGYNKKNMHYLKLILVFFSLAYFLDDIIRHNQ